jgi:iron complex transport system substrate-binding protein
MLLRHGHWPSGWEGGGGGSPESEDLPPASHPEPLAEGGPVLWPVLAVTAALVLGANSATRPTTERVGTDMIGAAVAFITSYQNADGGFGERGSGSDPSVTAWAVLAIKAAGHDPARTERNGNSPADYLAGKPSPLATDLALRILALDALGEDVERLADELERLREPNGRIGPFVNSTTWGVIALRAADRPVHRSSVRYLILQQQRSGGWSWHPRAGADTDDTAAAIEALRAAGIGARSRAIQRGLAYINRFRRRDGGFAMGAGASNTQTTAWVIQALVASGRNPGRKPFAYLARMRRRDGGFRYSADYAHNPLIMTARVVPALARRPFPLP